MREDSSCFAIYFGSKRSLEFDSVMRLECISEKKFFDFFILLFHSLWRPERMLTLFFHPNAWVFAGLSILIALIFFLISCVLFFNENSHWLWCAIIFFDWFEMIVFFGKKKTLLWVFWPNYILFFFFLSSMFSFLIEPYPFHYQIYLVLWCLCCFVGTPFWQQMLC